MCLYRILNIWQCYYWGFSSFSVPRPSGQDRRSQFALPTVLGCTCHASNVRAPETVHDGFPGARPRDLRRVHFIRRGFLERRTSDHRSRFQNVPAVWLRRHDGRLRCNARGVDHGSPEWAVEAIKCLLPYVAIGTRAEECRQTICRFFERVDRI